MKFQYIVGGDGVILVVTVDSAPAFPISDVVVEVDKVVLLEGSVDCVKASDDAISRSSCFSADDIIDNVEVMLGIPALVKSICWAPADVDINSSVVEDDHLAVALLTVTRGNAILQIKHKVQIFLPTIIILRTTIRWHEIYKKIDLQWTAITPKIMPATREMVIVKTLN